MAEYSRIPLYKSNPVLRGIGSGSLRSYDSRVMDLYTDLEDDDYGFKSMPEYALQRIFGNSENLPSRLSQSVGDQMLQVPDDMTPVESPATVRKKRKAPDPPSNMVAARQKYPSSDDIMNDNRNRVSRTGRSANMRPMSLSPNRLTADLWEELLGKLNSKSPSPVHSPRVNRTKTLLSKLRSPRIMHRGSRRKRTTSADDDEAGFKQRSLSNNSSVDEADGFTEETIFFVVLCPDLVRDSEFEVSIYV